MNHEPPRLVKDADGRWRGAFRAMASPWEVHIAGASADELTRVNVIVAQEVQRIESKYSRYRPDGLVHEINNAGGRSVSVDEETARLLDYADELWNVSEGLFDITTGALRRGWTFDGSDRLPTVETISQLLRHVGWNKVRWSSSSLSLPAGMEIDFGGIGKEYAVDRALALARESTKLPVLINGGGDLAASAPPAHDQPWRVGIDTGFAVSAPSLKLYQGAVATSGDANRFLLKDGVRYGHVLDPRTGWPVADAPRSVTVLATTCSEAGSHATLALLQGPRAKKYLEEEGVEYWVR